MKVKHFDRFQHYLLDAIWKKKDEGTDLARILDLYTEIGFTGHALMASDRAVTFALHLDEQLRQFPAVDPDHGKWREWGFVVPFPGGQPDDVMTHTDEDDNDVYAQSLAIAVPGTTGVLFCVEKRERVLPTASINDKVADRVKAMCDREQREPNRKDYAMIKDEVIAAELKTAPVRRARTYVLLWEKDQYVFTASQKSAEETNAVIRRAISSWPVIPAYSNEFAMKEFFKNVVLRKKDLKEQFIPGGQATFMNEERERLTVKDSDLEEERYEHLITEEKFCPIELQFKFLTGDERLDSAWVKMNQKGDVKALSTTSEADDDIQAQNERGSAGYQSKMAEIWLLMQVIARFSAKMESLQLMTNREDDDVLQELDGDLSDNEHVARLQEKVHGILEKHGMRIVTPEAEEEDSAWETIQKESAIQQFIGDDEEDDDDGTFALPEDDEDEI